MNTEVNIEALPKVLIVDDEPTNLGILHRLLSELKVEVFEAVSGEEALSLVMCHHFVVVLMDVNMPSMNGIETANRMREHDKMMATPVIFISGYDMDELDQLEGYAVGAADYIIKPVNPDILLSKVSLFLELYLQSEELKKKNDLLKHVNMERYRQYDLTRRLLNMNPDSMLVIDNHNMILYANPAAATLFNSKADHLRGDLFEFPLIDVKCTEITLAEDQVVEMSVLPIDWAGESVFLVTLHDISILKQTEAKLLHLARYDQLTGLANRRYCLEFMEDALVRARRRNSYIAVLFMDLDKFKAINDNLGHEVGDQLLVSVANRLKNCVRESDLASRFGGDEFVLILDDIADPDVAETLAKKITDHLAIPHVLNDNTVVVGCSIGISTYPQSGDKPEALFKAADEAMYKVKSSGGNNF